MVPNFSYVKIHSTNDGYNLYTPKTHENNCDAHHEGSVHHALLRATLFSEI